MREETLYFMRYKDVTMEPQSWNHPVHVPHNYFLKIGQISI